MLERAIPVFWANRETALFPPRFPAKSGIRDLRLWLGGRVGGQAGRRATDARSSQRQAQPHEIVGGACVGRLSQLFINRYHLHISLQHACSASSP